MEKLRKKIYRWMDYFIHPSRLDNPNDDIFKVRMIVTYAFLGIPISIFFLSIREVFTLRFTFAFWNILLACSINLMLIKKSQISTDRIGAIGSFQLMLSMIAFSYGHQTFFHGTFFWYIPSVVMTMLFVGRRVAFIQMLIYISIIVISHILYRENGLVVPTFWPYKGWINNLAADQIVSLFFTFVTMYFFLLNRERSTLDLKIAHQKILEQQDKMNTNARLAELGELAGGIAHEINNPLQVISGNIEILIKEMKKEQKSEEKINQQLLKVQSTVKRISNIINTMKGYSRDGSQDAIVDVNVYEIVEEIKDFLGEKLKMRQIELVNQIPKDLNVFARKVQVFQILVNLCNNSVDAMESSITKQITIIADNFSDSVLLSIIDTGPGIPIGMEEKVLTPFYTTKEFGKGTGLGLSISYKIMRDYGGDLYIDRAYGDSRICLYFPKKRV